MSEIADIDRFVKDPSLLVELCREVIDQLDASSGDTGVVEHEAQLRAIAKAVDQLEKSGVPCRTHCARRRHALRFPWLCTPMPRKHCHNWLTTSKTSRGLAGPTDSESAPHPNQSHVDRGRMLPKTSNKVLRRFIVEALVARGRTRPRIGNTRRCGTLDLKVNCSPAISMSRKDGKTIAWQNNAQWERLQMTQDGALRRDSPRGIWELGEDHQ